MAKARRKKSKTAGTAPQALVTVGRPYDLIRRLAVEVDGPRGGGGPGMAHFLPVPPGAKVACSKHDDCAVCPFCDAHLGVDPSVCEHVVTDFGSDTTWEAVARCLALPALLVCIDARTGKVACIGPVSQEEEAKYGKLLSKLPVPASLRGRFEAEACRVLKEAGILAMPSAPFLQRYR